MSTFRIIFFTLAIFSSGAVRCTLFGKSKPHDVEKCTKAQIFRLNYFVHSVILQSAEEYQDVDYENCTVELSPDSSQQLYKTTVKLGAESCPLVLHVSHSEQYTVFHIADERIQKMIVGCQSLVPGLASALDVLDASSLLPNEVSVNDSVIQSFHDSQQTSGFDQVIQDRSVCSRDERQNLHSYFVRLSSAPQSTTSQIKVEECVRRVQRKGGAGMVLKVSYKAMFSLGSKTCILDIARGPDGILELVDATKECSKFLLPQTPTKTPMQII